MRKYYYKKEDSKECFLEVFKPTGEEVFKNDYLEIGRKIKYQFLSFFSAENENMEELGYYAYKRLLDTAITNI